MTAVLLTGSRAPATVELARHFAAAGAFVVVADSQPALASRSRAVGKSYRVPSARFRPREFAEAIAGIARRHAVDLVIPCNEEIFWLTAARAEALAACDRGEARPRDDLVGRMPLFAPPLDVLRRLHDKAAFVDLLDELGVAHPATAVVASRIRWRRLSAARSRSAAAAAASPRAAAGTGLSPRVDDKTPTATRSTESIPVASQATARIPVASRATADTSAPARATAQALDAGVVIKPAFSRFGARTRFAAAGEPLPELERVTRDERWLVQEWVTGDEFSCHAVAVAGRITAIVAYRSVARAGAGAGVAFDRVDPSATEAVEARRIAALLAAELGLTGQFGLDLIRRTGSREGEVVVLECNPRATSGLHLFTPGDGLPAAFAPAFSDTSTRVAAPGSSAASPAAPTPAARDHGGRIVEGSRASARLGVPHLLYAVPAVRSLDDLRRFGRQLRSPDALRPRADPLPLTVLARSLAVQVSSSWRYRVPLLAAATADIEWNGEPLPGVTAPAAPWVAAFVSGFGAVASRSGTLDDIPECLVENADVLVEGIEVAGVLLPVTRPRPPARPAEPSRDRSARGPGSLRPTPADRPGSLRPAPASYVVSPISHYVHYAREELRLVRSPVARAVGGATLTVLERVLRAGRADDVAIVGNALVSTNLLPDLDEAAVVDVTRRLVAAHPDLAVAWRSVHGRSTRLPESLRLAGYRLIPSRSVLFAPTRDSEWTGLRDVVRDRALLEGSGYAVRPAPVDAATGVSDRPTLERIAELYGQLYLDKYSRLNPIYTPGFIAHAQRSGLLRFVLLERDGRVDAVIGYAVAHGLLAAPVVGYDTRLPREAGLYRMLSVVIAQTAHREGADLHASSGVADFKRHRGGEPELEYFAVTARHLGLRPRAAWAVLDLLVSRVVAPAVQRAGL